MIQWFSLQMYSIGIRGVQNKIKRNSEQLCVIYLVSQNYMASILYIHIYNIHVDMIETYIHTCLCYDAYRGFTTGRFSSASFQFYYIDSWFIPL